MLYLDVNSRIKHYVTVLEHKVNYFFNLVICRSPAAAMLHKRYSKTFSISLLTHIYNDIEMLKHQGSLVTLTRAVNPQ